MFLVTTMFVGKRLLASSGVGHTVTSSTSLSEHSLRSQIIHISYDTTDKNKRIMERLKWRKPSVISRRLEIAFGPDIGPDNVGRRTV